MVYDLDNTWKQELAVCLPGSKHMWDGHWKFQYNLQDTKVFSKVSQRMVAIKMPPAIYLFKV